MKSQNSHDDSHLPVRSWESLCLYVFNLTHWFCVCACQFGSLIASFFLLALGLLSLLGPVVAAAGDAIKRVLLTTAQTSAQNLPSAPCGTSHPPLSWNPLWSLCQCHLPHLHICTSTLANCPCSEIKPACLRLNISKALLQVQNTSTVTVNYTHRRWRHLFFFSLSL